MTIITLNNRINLIRKKYSNFMQATQIKKQKNLNKCTKIHAHDNNFYVLKMFAYLFMT